METIVKAKKPRHLYFCDFTPEEPTESKIKWCPIKKGMCEGIICMFWRQDMSLIPTKAPIENPDATDDSGQPLIQVDMGTCQINSLPTKKEVRLIHQILFHIVEELANLRSTE